MNFVDLILLLEFRSSRVEFYNDLAEMFESNENFRSFLERQHRISKKSGQNSLHRALGIVISRFDDGGASSDTDAENLNLSLEGLLRGVVPDGDLVPLSAIDKTADKHKGLRALAQSVERQREAMATLLKAAIVPIFLIPLSALLSYTLSGVIVSIEKSAPDFVREILFKAPSFNWLIREMAVFARDYGVLVLVIFAALIGILFLVMNFLTGPLRSKLDKLPVFSLYRDYQAAGLLSNLSMLLGSGTKLIPSLELLANGGARWTKWQTRRVLSYLEVEPNKYQEAFTQGLCSPYVEGRIETLVESVKQREIRGDQSVSFGDVLIRIGGVESTKALEKINKSAIQLNGVIAAVVGGYAVILGFGSMTVPGKFSTLMEPNQIIQLKQQFDAKKAASALAGK